MYGTRPLRSFISVIVASRVFLSGESLAVGLRGPNGYVGDIRRSVAMRSRWHYDAKSVRIIMSG